MTAFPLDPLACRSDGKYRFELKAPFRVRIDAFAGRLAQFAAKEFRAEDGVPWGRLAGNGVVTMFTGYNWNGCSPAFEINGKWLGTPTPESVRIACAVHDLLYQFLDEGYWTRAEADAVFYALMQREGFPLAPIYYGAVRVFGGLHHFLYR